MRIRIYDKSHESDVISLWKQVLAYREPQNDLTSFDFLCQAL